jgi:hypothetical protein
MALRTAESKKFSAFALSSFDAFMVSISIWVAVYFTERVI